MVILTEENLGAINRLLRKIFEDSDFGINKIGVQYPLTQKPNWKLNLIELNYLADLLTSENILSAEFGEEEGSYTFELNQGEPNLFVENDWEHHPYLQLFVDGKLFRRFVFIYDEEECQLFFGIEINISQYIKHEEIISPYSRQFSVWILKILITFSERYRFEEIKRDLGRLARSS